MSFEDLKAILAKFLNPDLKKMKKKDEVSNSIYSPVNDLPWDDDDKELRT